ncbi:uncharacterized protein FIBRA_02132 [Fibroporia radiculosa]|uniref:NADH dehydrogenase [ubiquinone] 1 beta subcomplex subunit 8, mitochondrial n=1 Tax=Fibroporia radiculosa TaxID=599839 RepID=J4GMH7_9APHY|nr:uncharacterized protein FIBRA_02132 [Fibroporia radiculosa]CCM00105.1 predicted protein [Fibroporia radiculosa]
MNTVITARASGLRTVLRASRAALALRSYATPAAVKEDDDPQLADYPRLPYISRQRLPARGWDDWQMRRNFGDPLHEQDEIISMWGPDASVVEPSTALRHFTIAFLGFFAFGATVKYALIPERPSVPREYPFSGLVTELGGLEENKARPEDESEDE